ncbi:hypothetical protein AMTR_s00119p00037450 [Amborella trichopoda]|uniref:DUF4283 domain-containing protein n=1 Tax=Amborella trichopoda TaxID=13333 RepID=W1NNB1_AMBTC|nr:hypothetical protein AMTR_s00119p00037450 [Amborella trichopoda]
MARSSWSYGASSRSSFGAVQDFDSRGRGQQVGRNSKLSNGFSKAHRPRRDGFLFLGLLRLEVAMVGSFCPPIDDLSKFDQWVLKAWKFKIDSKYIPGNRLLTLFGFFEDAKKIAKQRLLHRHGSLLSLKWWNSTANPSLIKPSSSWLHVEGIPVSGLHKGSL